MIGADGWFDWMSRDPGPPDKVNSGVNSAKLFLPHSAVGYYEGWRSRLMSQERRPDGRYTAYAAASVHGWTAYDGTCIQHYPVTARCWSSGSGFPNNNGIAFENEGGFNPVNEPLRPAQVAAIVRILQDLEQWSNRPADYWQRPLDAADLTATLYEHRECIRFGSAPTACPSDRVPWPAILSQLQPAPPAPPEELMIRHNAIAAWYDDRELDGLRPMVARTDLGLPYDAVAVRLELFVKKGILRVLDGGPDHDYAGQAGWGGVLYATVDVMLDEHGNCFLEGGAPGDTEIGRIGCVGYFR